MTHHCYVTQFEVNLALKICITTTTSTATMTTSTKAKVIASTTVATATIEYTTISIIIGLILWIWIIQGWIVRIWRWNVTLSNINQRWINKALLKFTSPIKNGSNLLLITMITRLYSSGRLSRTVSRCSHGRTRSPYNPSTSTMHLMRRRNLCIGLCSSIAVLNLFEVS